MFKSVQRAKEGPRFFAFYTFFPVVGSVKVAYVRDDKDVLRLIEPLIQSTTPPGAQSSDSFWQKSETALLQALVLYLKHEAPPEEQNFAMVMEMLSAAEVREEDGEYESPLDILFARLEIRDPESIAVKQYYDEVVILLETGLRISELCGLTPDDLNFENRFVNVDHQLLRSTKDGYYIEAPKTESGFRQVPMSAAAYEAFERVLKKRRDGRCIEVDGYKDFLFLNRDGLPKTAVNYDAMFKCLAKKYNKCHKEPLPDVMTPHTMRHTFCTRMAANAGMKPKALQYIMGHANIVMTLNYYAYATFHFAQEEMERLQAKAKTTTEAKPEPAAESAEETKAA